VGWEQRRRAPHTPVLAHCLHTCFLWAELALDWEGTAQRARWAADGACQLILRKPATGAPSQSRHCFLGSSPTYQTAASSFTAAAGSPLQNMALDTASSTVAVAPAMRIDEVGPPGARQGRRHCLWAWVGPRGSPSEVPPAGPARC